MSRPASQPGPAARRRAPADAALAILVVAGLACVSLLSPRLDAARPQEDPFATYEELYATPEAARRITLAFNGLAADWYWLRALQYLGRKVETARGPLSLDDLGALGLRNLGPTLELSAALDPQFMAVYEFGAVVLPAIDDAQAVRLIERGIRENPGEWRLHQHLGYIHWQAGRYREASEAYGAGARVAGAPAWMEAMAAQMHERGGSRAVARETYRRMHEGAADEQVRALALARLAQLDSLEEREAIGRALADFRARASRCPAAWREVAPRLHAAGLRLDSGGAPLDPSGVPYVLDAASCEARLGEQSKIPKR
jgi:tetratricopeptide (TPR) repeat protein